MTIANFKTIDAAIKCQGEYQEKAHGSDLQRKGIH